MPPPVFLLALMKVYLRLSNVYIEHYYMFWLALLLWAISDRELPMEKRLFWMNFAGFWAFTSRPALALVYVAVLVYTVYCTVKKQLRVRRLVLTLLLPALVLTANAAVNYRETGHWVWLENYSAQDVCRAVNPASGTEHWTDETEKIYTDEKTRQIAAREDLDVSERSVLFKAYARECIRQDPVRIFKNAVVKFGAMFLRHWYGLTVLAVAGAAGIAIRYPGRRKETAVILLVMLIEAAITSIGIVEPRYSYIIWMSGSLHMSALAHGGLSLCKRLIGKRSPERGNA